MLLSTKLLSLLISFSASISTDKSLSSKYLKKYNIYSNKGFKYYNFP